MGYSPVGIRKLTKTRRRTSPKSTKMPFKSNLHSTTCVMGAGGSNTLPSYRSQQWSSNRGRTVQGTGNPALKYYMQQPKENELFFGPKYKRIEKPLIRNDDVCESNKINTALPGRHQRLVTRQGQRIDLEGTNQSMNPHLISIGSLIQTCYVIIIN